MKRILVDCDGPLSDFDGAAMRFLHSRVPSGWQPPLGMWKLQDALDPDLRQEVEAHFSSQGFVANMEPTKGAQQGFKRLQSLAHVYVVTTSFPNSFFWPAERIAWLKRFGCHEDHIVLTAAKYVVYGDALLDDRPANLFRWKEHHPNGTAMLWKTRGNYGYWQDPNLLIIEGWEDPALWNEVMR